MNIIDTFNVVVEDAHGSLQLSVELQRHRLTLEFSLHFKSSYLFVSVVSADLKQLVLTTPSEDVSV